MTFLWRMAKGAESEAQGAADGAANSFTDVPADAYFYDAVRWAVDHGITMGVRENEFAPDQSCTRAQIVTFLFRARLLLEVA